MSLIQRNLNYYGAMALSELLFEEFCYLELFAMFGGYDSMPCCDLIIPVKLSVCFFNLCFCGHSVFIM